MSAKGFVRFKVDSEYARVSGVVIVGDVVVSFKAATLDGARERAEELGRMLGVDVSAQAKAATAKVRRVGRGERR